MAGVTKGGERDVNALVGVIYRAFEGSGAKIQDIHIHQ